MVTTRRVFGAVAVLASVVALSGLRPTTADDKKADPAADPVKVDADREHGATKVEMFTAAQTLIKVGKDEKSPVALLAAAELLYKFGLKEVLIDGKGLTIEGGSAPPKDAGLKTDVLKLLEDAKAMDKTADKHVAKLADNLIGEISGGARGTANGYTSSGLKIVNGGQSVTISRLFLGKQIGKICIAKSTVGTNVNLKYTLYDPSGAVVPSVVGDASHYAFIPKADGTYKLVISNPHTVDAGVIVTTN